MRLDIKLEELFVVVGYRETTVSLVDCPKIELTDAEYADYERVCSEYDAWQERLEAARLADPSR